MHRPPLFPPSPCTPCPSLPLSIQTPTLLNPLLQKEVSTGLEVCALREFVDGETPPTPTPPPDPPLLSTWPPLDPFNTTIR